MYFAQILSKLSHKRPIFHSERDFQHALAWEIHEHLPECSIRLEFRPPFLENRIYSDIWAIHGDTIVVIELKYKTRKLRVKVDEETFDLLDQSAQDQGRYDFLKDVQRLEQIVSGQDNIVGYAIFVTNDSAYWIPPRDRRTVDADFRIHQGRTLTGELRWRQGASVGTMGGREKSILIKGSYNLDWHDYSEVSERPYGKFKYLLVTVKSTKTS